MKVNLRLPTPKLTLFLYNNNPKICPYCNTIMSYKQRGNKFCSRTCAAKHNNKTRRVNGFSPSTKTRNKARISQYFKSNKADILTNSVSYQKLLADLKFKHCIVGEYTKVRKNRCIKTGKIFFSSGYKKFHPTIINDRHDYRRMCQFNFSVSEFPKEFDYGLVDEYGWYKAKNRGDNQNGISRDHIVSVEYGWQNNIDPKIISHPANCQLMRHKDNMTKKIGCGMTIEELLVKIEVWNSNVL